MCVADTLIDKGDKAGEIRRFSSSSEKNKEREEELNIVALKVIVGQSCKY